MYSARKQNREISEWRFYSLYITKQGQIEVFTGEMQKRWV